MFYVCTCRNQHGPARLPPIGEMLMGPPAPPPAPTAPTAPAPTAAPGPAEKEADKEGETSDEFADLSPAKLAPAPESDSDTPVKKGEFEQYIHKP